MGDGVDVTVGILDDADERRRQAEFAADLRKIVDTLGLQPDSGNSVMSFCLPTGECYALSSIIEALIAVVAGGLPSLPPSIPDPDVEHVYAIKGAG